MSENIEIQNENDLKELERKTFLIYYQDGLWDMLLGLTLIAFGIGMALYDLLPRILNSLFGLIIWSIGFVGFLLAKSYLIRPRMGIVKYRSERKMQLKVILIITIVCVILTITALILTITDTFNFAKLGIGIAVIFGVMPFLIFGSMAYLMNYYRLFIHAGIFSVAIFLNEILSQFGYGLIGNICFGSGGLIILVIGIVYLVKFLKKYPPYRGEEFDS